jgi:hypothetical protein
MSKKLSVKIKIYDNKNDEKNYKTEVFICDSYQIEKNESVTFTNVYTLIDSAVPYLEEYNHLLYSACSTQSQLHTVGRYPSELVIFNYYKIYPSVIINQSEVLAVFELDDLAIKGIESKLYQQRYDEKISMLKTQLERRLKFLDEQKNEKTDNPDESKTVTLTLTKIKYSLRNMISMLKTAYKTKNFRDMKLHYTEGECNDA